MSSFRLAGAQHQHHFQALDHKNTTNRRTDKNNNTKQQQQKQFTIAVAPFGSAFFFANFSAALLNGDVPLFRSLVSGLSLAYNNSIYKSYSPSPSPSPTSLLLLSFAFASLPTALGGRSCAPLRLRLKFSAVVIFHHSRMWRCR